ncbi:MAG: dienelactone hydrolase family protein [Pseudomonadota bacterium]|nr:dienelactone hydrolase family protein [Pseudomonadota bacterium]
MGETIKMNARDGGTFDAYLARPSAADSPAPGVIIIQEAFGVTPWIKAITDRFAAEGYLAAAPDFYWRFAPSFSATFDDEDAVAEARQHLKVIDHTSAVDDIEAAADTLKSMDGCNGKIATAGFCLGGTLAYLAAVRLPIDAAAAYYGTQIHEYLDEGSKLNCPTLFHMADHDAFIRDEDVKEVFQALIGIPNLAVWTYDAGHAFANWDRPGAYNEELAEKAHGRTFATFGKLKRD